TLSSLGIRRNVCGHAVMSTQYRSPATRPSQAALAGKSAESARSSPASQQLTDVCPPGAGTPAGAGRGADAGAVIVPNQTPASAELPQVGGGGDGDSKWLGLGLRCRVELVLYPNHA